MWGANHSNHCPLSLCPILHPLLGWMMMTDGCMQLFQRNIYAQHKNDRTIVVVVVVVAVVVVVVNTAAAILRASITRSSTTNVHPGC